MDKNRYVVEQLGICWHERRAGFMLGISVCSCGITYKDGHEHINPDFTTKEGRVQLLELMMGREDWTDFKQSIDCLDWPLPTSNYFDVYVHAKYITTPGALLDAVYEFLKGRE
jgi:hypothetical protein